jgi:hypothetical protein
MLGIRWTPSVGSDHPFLSNVLGLTSPREESHVEAVFGSGAWRSFIVDGGAPGGGITSAEGGKRWMKRVRKEKQRVGRAEYDQGTRSAKLLYLRIYHAHTNDHQRSLGSTREYQLTFPPWYPRWIPLILITVPVGSAINPNDCLDEVGEHPVLLKCLGCLSKSASYVEN